MTLSVNERAAGLADRLAADAEALRVAVAARVVETALHKLHEIDFDVRRIVSGFGTCPLPPVAKSDPEAIGRTNDAVLYGGRVELTVDAPDDELEGIVERVPSSASKDHGEPFGT